MAGVYGSNFDYGDSYYKDDEAPTSNRHERAMRRQWPVKQLIDIAGDYMRENLQVVGTHLDACEDMGMYLQVDIFPDTTTTLLESYERIYDLIDTGSTTDRRERIVTAHRWRGGLSKAYFEALGDAMGGSVYSVSIAEGTDSLPFIIHTYSPTSSPRGPATLLPGVLRDAPFTDGPYHITVTVTGSAGPETDLEEMYDRIKPPWTSWSYVYSP